MKINDITNYYINKVNGLENIDTSCSSVFISNHTYLMDIFFINQILEKEIATAISSRLLFKDEPERKKLINKFINPVPIEVHAGRNYINMCLNSLSNLLLNNISFNIFPEGAYLEQSNNIYKAHTGCIRALYEASKEVKVNLIPIAIDVQSKINNLNSYNISPSKVNISILKPIEYHEYFNLFLNTHDNKFLHLPLDQAMKNIAEEINKNYILHYIELRTRDDIIWPTGERYNIESVLTNNYVEEYQQNLIKIENNLVRKLK